MPSPVKHTCPDIDKAIKGIKTALKTAIDGKKESTKGDDAYQCFDIIEDELWDMPRQLEALRSDNDHLRKWGHECEELITELEEELSKIKHQ